MPRSARASRLSDDVDDFRRRRFSSLLEPRISFSVLFDFSFLRCKCSMNEALLSPSDQRDVKISTFAFDHIHSCNLRCQSRHACFLLISFFSIFKVMLFTFLPPHQPCHHDARLHRAECTGPIPPQARDQSDQRRQPNPEPLFKPPFSRYNCL